MPRPERGRSGGAVAQDEAQLNQPVAGAANQAPAVMRRVRAPLTLRGAPGAVVDPHELAPPVPDPLGRPALGPDITTFERPWDKQASDYFTGVHMLVQRPVGNKAGVQEPIGLPTPVVYRPVPLPWWCGTVVTSPTPDNPVPPARAVPANLGIALQAADTRPDVMSRLAPAGNVWTPQTGAG